LTFLKPDSKPSLGVGTWISLIFTTKYLGVWNQTV
jgi:hypothetical protein